MTLDRVAMATSGNLNRRRIWRMEEQLKAADQILDKEREAMPLRRSLEPCEAGRIDWWIQPICGTGGERNK